MALETSARAFFQAGDTLELLRRRPTDTRPNVYMQIVDLKGDPLDLTDFTTVAKLRELNGRVAAEDIECTPDTAVEGKVYFAITAANMSKIGYSRVEVILTMTKSTFSQENINRPILEIVR